MISKQRRACASAPGSHDQSGQTGAVPETRTRSPTRTAREKPTFSSHGEPDEARRSSSPAEVLAHPLDRLFEALVGRGQGDAEEALAARPYIEPGETTTAASSSTSSAKEVEVWPSGTGAQT